MTVLNFDCQYRLILYSNPTKPSVFDHCIVITQIVDKNYAKKCLESELQKNVRASPLITLAVLGLRYLLIEYKVVRNVADKRIICYVPATTSHLVFKLKETEG
jgi:hypothetical protein